MKENQIFLRHTFLVVALMTMFFSIAACGRDSGSINPSSTELITTTALPSSPILTVPASTLAIQQQPTAVAPTTGFYPTPDPVREFPKLRDYEETHVVGYGDTLNKIAFQYSVGVQQIQEANAIVDPNILSIGIVLRIPPPIPQPPGPSWKLIPDSEILFGPSTVDPSSIRRGFSRTSTLASYVDFLDDGLFNGPAIVMRVAENFSINPKLLIAILEAQSGWAQDVDGSNIGNQLYPLGWFETGKEGLYEQLSWAADQLNAGYYRWLAGWSGPYIFADGRVVPPGSGVNAGTVAVQHLFSLLLSVEDWRILMGADGFGTLYNNLFGEPFAAAIEPMLPVELTQPDLALPFEKGRSWSFTGGPHSSFGNSGPWAALDFAPSSNAVGCVQSNAWVVASADGMVVRSGRGQVVQDLDGDAYEQTGWSMVYLHIETRDRVPAGTYLKTGDRIGHPSCEGGISTGTHVHIMRKYNGQWILADGPIPFNIGGWITEGAGTSYNGSLTYAGNTILACSCRAAYNQISW